MKLSDLPPRMQTKQWIENEIRYEESPGIHTYHQCECGRGVCRSSACVKCWKELLASVAQ